MSLPNFSKPATSIKLKRKNTQNTRHSNQIKKIKAILLSENRKLRSQKRNKSRKKGKFYTRRFCDFL
jgi:hypothetical protein